MRDERVEETGDARGDIALCVMEGISLPFQFREQIVKTIDSLPQSQVCSSNGKSTTSSSNLIEKAHDRRDFLPLLALTQSGLGIVIS